MKDIADGADLLATARAALVEDLLPSLPKDARYLGHMIARAIAIAMREQASGANAEAAELERLKTLVGATRVATLVDNAASSTDLRALRLLVSRAIRSGHFDAGDASAMLLASLKKTADESLAISNPRAALQRSAP
jgi:hypothetical protein